MMTRKYYVSPLTACDWCGESLEDTMYDVSVPPEGRWGCLCHDCFTSTGCSLGIGRGQKYELQGDGGWLKTS